MGDSHGFASPHNSVPWVGLPAKPVKVRLILGWLLVTGLTLWIWIAAATAEPQDETSALPSRSLMEEYDHADVLVDGRAILNVRGVEAFPAQQRAKEIARRIVAAAQDSTIPADAVRTENKSDRTTLRAGEHFLLTLIDADASRKRRGEVVDKLAAAYALQGVLDALQERIARE